jgi:sugar lactone lactonase YvrE
LEKTEVRTRFYQVFSVLLLPVFTLAQPAYSSTSDIHTFAGTGPAAYSGDGGPATAAGLSSPAGIAADTAGNIYIADTANNVVRMVDGAGAITTVAGTGAAGYTGDTKTRANRDGSLRILKALPAASSALDSPCAVAFDPSGNMYIADTGNNRIRKVDTHGNIFTVAGAGTPGYSGDGGPASSAQLNMPQGVAVDASGILYISDTANNRVRRVDAGGKITTVAGTGASGYSGDGGSAVLAKLNNPSFISAGPYGNLFIADTFNSRIRKLTPTGQITTVAGNGTASYSGDGGPAVSAALYFPAGVTSDASGNIYITDSYNHRVRKVSASGAITTFAGTGVAGITGDGGPASAAQLDYPSGLATDKAGNIYISDGSANRTRLVEGPSYALPTSTILLPRTGDTIDTVNYNITGRANASDGVAYVEVSTDGGTTWSTASGTSNFSLSWNPATDGAYRIMSRSTDALGKKETLMSLAEVSVSAAPVPAVTVTTLSPSKPSLTVGDTANWTMAAAGGTGSYEYRVYRRGPDTGGVYMLKRDWAASDVWSMTASAAMVGTDDIMVEARNSDGSGSVASKEYLGYTVSNAATTGQATLAWDASTSSSVSGYRIYAGTSPGVYTRTIDTGSAATYTVTGLAYGTTYYFAVTAYDASGNESGYSNQVSRNIM